MNYHIFAQVKKNQILSARNKIASTKTNINNNDLQQIPVKRLKLQTTYPRYVARVFNTFHVLSDCGKATRHC